MHKIKIMKYLILISALIFGQKIMSAQANFPIITNVDDLKTFVPVDSFAVADLRSGMGNKLNLKGFVISDNIFFGYYEEFNFYLGGYVIATSTTSGEEIWRNYIGWRKQGYAFNFNDISLNNNGNIELTGYRFGNGSCLLDYYEMNKIDGEIVNQMEVSDFSIADEISCSLDFLRFNSDKFVLFGINFPQQLIVSEIYNQESKLLKRNSHPFEYTGDFIKRSRNEKLKGGYQLLIDRNFYGESEEEADQVRMLDRYLISFDDSLMYKSTKILNSDNLPYSLVVNQMGVLNGNNVLLCRDGFYPDPKLTTSAIVIVDINGEILNTYDLGVTGIETFKILYHMESEKYILAITNSENNTIEIFNGNRNNELTHVRSLIINDEVFLTNAGNNNTELVMDVVSKNNSAKILWFLNIKDDGIISSVKDISTVPIKILPNPVTDFLKIDGLECNSDYIIHDISGSVIAHGALNHSQEINVSSLPVGTYLLTISKMNKSLKFVKI